MIFSVTLSCDASHQKILAFGNISDLLLILINFDKNAIILLLMNHLLIWIIIIIFH